LLDRENNVESVFLGIYPTPFNLFKMILPELKSQFQE
jgi:hypothetical protein